MRMENQDSMAGAGGKPRRVVKLSPAEAAVVAQLAQGLTNREIAAKLGKAPATVKNQLVSVYRKLGVNSRIRLMVLFRP
jgi:LuxR family maltose regulon positive regulatory protein